MFDNYAQSLFTDFSEFEGLTRANATRILSAAYLSIVQRRANGPDGSPKTPDEERPYLRRLANTLLFHVVLRPNRDSAARQAAAFVAAESIALMADYLALDRESQRPAVVPVRSAEQFARIESALLYLFAQYDACASAVLRESSGPGPDATLVDQAAHWAFARLEQLCKLQLYPPLDSDFPFVHADGELLSVDDLERDTIARLYLELGRISSALVRWLGTTDGTESAEVAAVQLQNLAEALSPEPNPRGGGRTGYEFGRIFHLCTLLRICWPQLQERALLHVVPSPTTGDTVQYTQYLESRAVGHASSPSRPLLWPSAVAYVKECILGDTQHAVVSMPTGAGKSFIGELAVSQAVGNGWALYLAPTNALAEQIRGDLRKGLRVLGTDVLAFLGDQEYSILETDRVVEMPANSVAVMTPEKCALALRLSPAVFANCRLVVFDECHLLGELGSIRGPLAELVLTQLMLRAPESRLLLMSAIVQNPEELAQWLEDGMGGRSKALVVYWRPTRALRTVLGIHDSSYRRGLAKATEELARLAASRTRQKFRAKCAVAANLRGAWQTEDQEDYRVVGLQCEAALAVRRELVAGKWDYRPLFERWVNDTATAVATVLVEGGVRTLVFTPANRNYPFTNGRKVKFSTRTLSVRSATPSLVDACEVLAEYELGCRSEVFELLSAGVAVHTALMLETEKIASEKMFRSGAALMMFATGTLAQGLNLPALAVIIAGSRIGDPRGEDRRVVERRRFSQLLNAAGRAGRAGFANQGLVVAIPDQPVAFGSFNDVKKVRQQVDYLQHSDDSVRVQSGLEQFIDSVCEGTLRPHEASDLEMLMVSLLAGGDEGQLSAGPVLRRTFGAYLRRRAGRGSVSDSDAGRLMELGGQFVDETGAPPWVTVAAQRAGLHFFLTWAIVKAWERVRPAQLSEVVRWSVPDWTEELLRVVAHIPPAWLSRYVKWRTLKGLSPAFAEVDGGLLAAETVEWSPPEQWVEAWKAVFDPLWAWMEGRALREVAAIVAGVAIEGVPADRTQGKPIPKALAVVGETWSALALIAGGFLAVAEQVLEGDVSPELASLPMCVKYGCDSPETLAWFRFGLRLRRPSRLLAMRLPPPRLENDEEMREWVRNAKRRWLSGGGAGHDEDPEARVLRAIRTFTIG